MLNTPVDLTNIIFPNNRTDLRRFIIEYFLKEAPGTGNGDLTQKYRYDIKRFSNNRVLYLDRPAPLNKGFDFIIRVENYRFIQSYRGKQDAPKHAEIISDLKLKKAGNPCLYGLFIKEIEKVYNCLPYLIDISWFSGIGIPVDILIEIIRWLFIEQDVTYWNYSGRAMFFDGIKSI